MILIFFAALCALVWRYIDTMKDNPDSASDAIIPGLKYLLLLFAAVLVLVDAQMFFETDRLVMAAAGSVNGSCVSYTGSYIFYPDALALINGSNISGSVSSLGFRNDGDIYTVIEESASPPALIYINYTDVTSFTAFHFNGYNDRAGSLYTLQFQRASDGVWVTEYAFTGTTGMIENNVNLNGTGYINGTNVSARITSSDTGNVSNRLNLDWLVLDGATTYTAYCPDSSDTANIFIYHNLETDMMVVLLSVLPYMAIGIFGFLTLQVLILINYYANRKKNGKEGSGTGGFK